jgi:hypothetical protein
MQDGPAYSFLKNIDNLLGATLDPKDWTCLLQTGLDLNDLVAKIKKVCPALWISVLIARAPMPLVDKKRKEGKMLLHLVGCLLRKRYSDLLLKCKCGQTIVSLVASNEDHSSFTDIQGSHTQQRGGGNHNLTKFELYSH